MNEHALMSLKELEVEKLLALKTIVAKEYACYHLEELEITGRFKTYLLDD